MTLPVYEETFFGQTTTNGTNHSVTLPATINRGDLLILVCASDGNPTMSAPSGWTVIQPAAYNGTAVGLAVFGKVAVGTEDGTSVTWTTGASEQTSTVGARVTGWGGTLADIKVGTAATGLSTGPNPPSLNPPDYGTEDFLWLAYLAADSNKSVNSGPGGGFSFSSQQGSSTNNATAALARFAQNNNVMDPGAFTLSGSDDWVANTIAIIGSKTLFTEDFEGRGTSPAAGDALSSTNTFWDLFNGVGTREFAGSPKVNGNFSGEFITTGTGQALVKDTTTLPGVVNGGVAYKSLWFRFYVRTPDDMNIDNRIFVIEESSADGGSDIAVIRLSGANGFATILDGTTVRATGTHQVDAHSHQHRMELWVDQETDYFELRMWWGADSNDPSTAATNYESISGTLSSNDVMQVFGVGNFSGVNASLYIDEFAVAIGGWIGPPSVPTDVSSSDTATATDAATTVARSSTAADTATATDGQSVDQGSTAKSSSDTASGTEAASLGTALTSADTATGTDAASLATALSSSDTATGASAQSVAVQLTSADTATGTEAVAARQITAGDSASATDAQSLATALSSTDSAAGSETQSLAVTISGADTGAGSDATTARSAAAADTAAGTDAGSVAATASSTDTATGTDAVSARALTAADSAMATEGHTLAAGGAASDTDTATASEAASLAVSLTSSDTATATETAISAHSAADSATATDAGSVARATTTADTATGTEAASVAVALTSSDSATGTEATTATAKTSSDSASDTEAASLAAALSSSDTGTGAEAASLSVARTSSDTATGTEAASAAVAITSSDGATGTEAASLSTALTAADTATGTDQVSARALGAADTATVTDVGDASTAWEELAEGGAPGDVVTAFTNSSFSTSAFGLEFTDEGEIPQGAQVIRQILGTGSTKFATKNLTQPGDSRYFRGYYRATRVAHDFWRTASSGGVTNVKLRFNSDGTIGVYDGATLRATSTKVFAASEWFRWEIRLNANTSTMTFRLFWGPALHDVLLGTQPSYTEQISGLDWLGGTTYTKSEWGNVSSTGSVLWAMDGLASDLTDWLGPATVGPLRAFISGADTATGTETTQPLAVSSTDAATATEAASLAVARTSSDTATATDVSVSIDTGNLVSSSDTASATEAASLAVSRTASDTAVATEAVTATAKTASDTATAVDAASLTVPLSSADTATATDQTTSRALTSSDSATATDVGESSTIWEELAEGTAGDTITPSNTSFSVFNTGLEFYDGGQIPQGSSVIRQVPASGVIAKYATKNLSHPTTGTSRFFRGYHRANQIAHDFWRIASSAGITNAKLRMNSGGTISVYDAGTQVAASTKAFAVDEWFRWELRVNSNLNSMTLRLYWGPALHDPLLVTNSAYTEQITGITWSGSTTYTKSEWGNVSNTASVDWAMDAVASDISDWCGPTAVAPIRSFLSSADTATGASGQSVDPGSAVSSSDTASGASAQSLAATQAGADSASATETASLAVTVSNGDTATASDAGSVATSDAKSSADSATASDAVSARAITASDNATASEAVAARGFAGADTAAATDAVTAGVRATTVGDTASASESATVAYLLVSGDSATGVSAGSVAAAVTSSQTAISTDEIIARILTSADDASATEASTFGNIVSSGDTATAIDQVLELDDGTRNVIVYYGKGVSPRYATGVSRAGATAAVADLARSGTGAPQDQAATGIQRRHAEAVP